MRTLMLLVGTGLLSSPALAEAPPPPPIDAQPPATTAHVPAPASALVVAAGGGQPRLAASFVNGKVHYRACDGAPACSAALSDPAIALPSMSAPDVTLTAVHVGLDRRVLVVRGGGFAAVVAAVPEGREARVLWQGATGLVRGEDGELHGDEVQVVAGAEGEPDNVLLGEVRQDVSICGRLSLLAPKVLDARDLAFKSVTVQRLPRAEREAAIALSARPAPSFTSTSGLLQATGASSGIGAPGALTDGNLDTAWAENRGADGRGEFVQLRAPEQVPLTGLSLVVRPERQSSPRGVAPRRIWIATSDRLFDVSFPEDAWKRPGAAFDVSFAKPISTSCVAVVLEEAYGHGKDSEVTIAEVGAHTELDGQADVANLAQALAGSGARGDTAAAILARRGDVAYEAITAAYPRLDDAGRRRALVVMDGAPCARSAPLLASAVITGQPAEAQHAMNRLLRCDRTAAPALQQLLSSGLDERRLRAAQILALIAPDAAIASTAPWFGKVPAPMRAELRAVLAKASESNVGRLELGKHLADTTLPALVTIDLLRAASANRAGAALSPEGSAALGRLARPDADFRTRFLLLGPAVGAARSGDAVAGRFVVNALATDPNPHIRARAAEALGEWPNAWEPLVRALEQPNPRVREATLASIARLAVLPQTRVAWSPDLSRTISAILASDPFTFVRLHAVEVLAVAPRSDTEADRALAGALGEGSAAVRARAAEALGARGAASFADALRDRLEDDAEAAQVRASAARALGALCDTRSTDALGGAARFAAARTDSAGPQVVGLAAVGALGRLHPPDLARRLAPLLAKDAPPALQQAAKAAMLGEDRCPSGRR